MESKEPMSGLTELDLVLSGHSTNTSICDFFPRFCYLSFQQLGWVGGWMISFKMQLIIIFLKQYSFETEKAQHCRIICNVLSNVMSFLKYFKFKYICCTP